MGYSPWGHKGSDTTEHAHVHTHAYYPPVLESIFSFTH